jgi:ketosteroid isomerase-like protein
MSQENVEVVRAAYETLTSRGVEAFSEYWADDIEWRTMRDQWRGKHAGQVYLQELYNLFEDFTTETVDLVDAGDGRVVAYLRYGGRSKRVGVAVPPEYFAVLLHVRDGKITRALEYATKDEALAAVGLSE